MNTSQQDAIDQKDNTITLAENAYVSGVQENLNIGLRIVYWMMVLFVFWIIYNLTTDWPFSGNFKTVLIMPVCSLLFYQLALHIVRCRAPKHLKTLREGTFEKRPIKNGQSTFFHDYLGDMPVKFPEVWTRRQLFSYGDELTCEGCEIPLTKRMQQQYGAEKLYVITRVNNKHAIETEKPFAGSFATKHTAFAFFALVVSVFGTTFYSGKALNNYRSLAGPIQLTFSKTLHYDNFESFTQTPPILNSRVQITNATLLTDSIRKFEPIKRAPELLTSLERLKAHWQLKEKELIRLTELEPTSLDKKALSDAFPLLSKNTSFSYLARVKKKQWKGGIAYIYRSEHSKINKKISTLLRKHQFNDQIFFIHLNEFKKMGELPSKISLEQVKRHIVSNAIDKIINYLNTASYKNTQWVISYISTGERSTTLFGPTKQVLNIFFDPPAEEYSRKTTALITIGGLFSIALFLTSLFYMLIFSFPNVIKQLRHKHKREAFYNSEQ